MPQPMPVPILTQRKSPTERATPACCSPIAIRFTSLSTMTGQPSSWLSASRTGKPSQPGMIGCATGVDAEEAQLRGEPDVVRATSAARGGEPVGHDQSGLQQPVDLDGELG